MLRQNRVSNSNLHSIVAFLRKREKKADFQNVQASKYVKSES